MLRGDASNHPLSLHDALPIYFHNGVPAADLDIFLALAGRARRAHFVVRVAARPDDRRIAHAPTKRSEEHTSELQSRENLVCRLLLEKKKKLWHNYNTRMTAAN